MVDASITSSRVSGGRIAASRRASIVFPPPGGPTSSRLWAPPAAISSARLAYAWPRTSAKSRSSVAGAAGGSGGGGAAASASPLSSPTASRSVGAEHPEPFDGLGLRVVRDRHAEGLDTLPPARESDGEHSAHRLDLAVQRQLADHGEGADPPVRDRAGGGEDAECDRQVERGTFFPEVGRGQVHGDPVGRKGEAGVADRGAHPLAALAHCRVRKPYRGERGQARRDVDLYPHERGFDADKGCGQNPREHEGIVRSSGGARQCRMLDTIGGGRTRSAGARARSTKVFDRGTSPTFAVEPGRCLRGRNWC